MRSRIFGTVLIACLIAFAGPAWSQSRGGGHSGGGHSFAGGHSSSGGHHGHVGRGAPGSHWHGHHYPGFPFHGGGRFGWHGPFGWGGLYLSFPLWWDAYWAWGWPYSFYGYYGYDGYFPYYDYYDSYGYPNSSIFRVPPEPEAGGPDSGETSTSAWGVTSVTASGPSPVDMQVSPRSALVYLNGVLVGSVEEFDGHPDYLYLDPGRYTLDIRQPGYRNKSLKFNVGGENKVVLSVDLQVDPAGGAEGQSPPSPGLPFGRRFGPSFGPAPSQAEPSHGDGGAARPVLGPAVTALVLRVSPPGAAVYLDGTLIGTSDDLARLRQGVAVLPGPHRIDVLAPGHSGKTLDVNAEAGKKLDLSVTLQ